MLNKKNGSQASSGSGTVVGYRVEARVKPLPGMHDSPIKLSGGQILTTEWSEVYLSLTDPKYGVPLVGDYLFPMGQAEKLIPYDSALAIMWTLVARHCDIECRTVRYTMKYSHTMTYDGVVDAPVVSSVKYEKREIVTDNSQALACPLQGDIDAR